MRDSKNIRCLVCGSNRYAVFRNGSSFPHQNRKSDFDSSPKSKNDFSKKNIVYQSDYDLMKANEQFKKLMNEDEDKAPKADSKKDDDVKSVDSKKDEDAKSTDSKKDDDAKAADSKKDDDTKAADSKKDDDVKAADAGEQYNKAKSFFDDISCESKEKAEGSYEPRQWQFERVRNQQTFGTGNGGGGGFNPRHKFGQFQSPMNRGGGGYYVRNGKDGQFQGQMNRAGGNGFYPRQKFGQFQGQMNRAGGYNSRNQQTFGDGGHYLRNVKWD